MHYLKQFAVIIAISAISELLAIFIPLPIPASIYGMSLLFLLLMTGVLKLQQVESAANLLLGIMPALFVVSGAGAHHVQGADRQHSSAVRHYRFNHRDFGY